MTICNSKTAKDAEATPTGKWRSAMGNPLLRLALFALLLTAGASVLLSMGSDWKQWIESLGNLHPMLFLLAMSALPVAGFPISAFYFYAGVVYGWEIGVPLCLAALAINMSLSYVVARTLLRQPLSELVKRRGHELPRIRTPLNQLRTTFLLRTVPGPPFSLQNYILALADVRFSIYLPVSVTAQGLIGCLLIVSTDLLTPQIEPWKVIAGALVLLTLVGIIGSVFLKRRESKPGKQREID